MVEPVVGEDVLRDAAETFAKLQELLKAKDDTSRFVGLALLKTVLDNGQLTQDSDRIRILWEALSPKFLDRLLRAHSNEKVSKAEAKDMVDLAVTVLHTFSILLPEESRKEKRLFGRGVPLLNALVESPPETTELILQTLLTITSQRDGALELLNEEDVSPLIELATEQPYALDVLNIVWTNASTSVSNLEKVRQSIDKTMPILLKAFQGTDAVTLIRFTADFIPKLDPEALSSNPVWLGKLISVLRNLVVSRPTQVGRAAYTQLAATLLQVYPSMSPDLLFRDDALPLQDRKPFSTLFINLLLIDIRSSFPSLLAQLNSSGYPAISKRLAAAFDVISGFVGFLVKSLDDESNSSTFSMPPDLLLRLRKDIAETMSLSIEYLRDRWDASIAGASGLHESARAGTAATSEGTRLTLTWESMKDTVDTDPLILASIRTLALWIREDENENLRNESAGLMDMLIELYKKAHADSLDFRYPVLLALEGILATDESVAGFLGQGGWKILMQDLETILASISDDPRGSGISGASDAARGLEVVRVLLTVIDHESTSYPEEAWMTAVKITASIRPAAQTGALPIVVELQIAMLQLSAALLTKAAGGMQKRQVTSISALSGLATQLEKIVTGMDDKIEAAEFFELLEDVNLSLDNLKLGKWA